MTDVTTQREALFGRLADEYLDRLQRGESPSPEEFRVWDPCGSGYRAGSSRARSPPGPTRPSLTVPCPGAPGGATTTKENSPPDRVASPLQGSPLQPPRMNS